MAPSLPPLPQTPVGGSDPAGGPEEGDRGAVRQDGEGAPPGHRVPRRHAVQPPAPAVKEQWRAPLAAEQPPARGHGPAPG